MKDVPDAHIQKAAETLPVEALDIFKRIVEAAEAAKPKLKREPVKKLGNSDKADSMDMCLCFWDEARPRAWFRKKWTKAASPAYPRGTQKHFLFFGSYNP